MNNKTPIETWLEEHKNDMFRYLVYKRMFTPFEQNQAFMDESQFESTHYNTGKIEEVIYLGAGEHLLGIRDFYDDEPSPCIVYYRLSEIRLEKMDDIEEGKEEENEL